MPAIKKKWMQTNMEDNSVKNDSELIEDEAVDSIDSVTEKSSAKITITTGPLKRLDGEVLLEKRKRFIPPAELRLSEWLDNNFEKRTEEKISLTLLYKYYTELCQASGSDILDVPRFNKMVKVKFGKSFGIQASSIYKAVIKEKKMGEKKTSGRGWKLKEIIIEAINHFGNPWHGIRFYALKHYIASRCPAMQIEAKPKILKRALEMGTNFGYVELTKGIGMMGSYRLPGAVEPPPKPKSKPKKETEKDGGEAKEGEDDGSSQNENEGEKEDGAVDGSGAEESGKEEAPKPKKPKKVRSWKYSKLSYSNPARIEDTFPLAITYQSAPKAAGVHRIRRYILDKYNEEVSDSRWRKCLDNGVDKGYWEHVSGSGMTGSIHLLMDDFDPNSEQLEDRICAAIIACHDPKSASARQIKKYVSRYHPDFDVDSKPGKFKKALIRAMDKKMIKQLSGLGASGTFMLVVPFTPSPTILAGDDDSDIEEDEEPEKNSYIPKGTKSRGRPKIKTMEVVKPKKTTKSSVTSSRGRKNNQKKTKKAVSSPVASNKNNKSNGSTKKSKKNGRTIVDNRGKSSKNARNARRSPSPLTDEEEDMVEYSPKKSQSRGGAGRSTPSSSRKAKSPAQKGGKKVMSTPSSPKKKGGSRRAISPVVMLDDIDSDDNTNDYTPRKSTSRGGGGQTPKQNGTPKSSKKRVSVAHSDVDDDDNDDIVEYTPRKSASRGGGNEVSSPKPKSARKRKADGDLDDGDDDDDQTATPKSPGKSSSGKKKSRR